MKRLAMTGGALIMLGAMGLMLLPTMATAYSGEFPARYLVAMSSGDDLRLIAPQSGHVAAGGPVESASAENNRDGILICSHVTRLGPLSFGYLCR
ncbi:MAG: hypothetical protein AB7O43_06510 [Hyphomicrobiaceae bacterium]